MTMSSAPLPLPMSTVPHLAPPPAAVVAGSAELLAVVGPVLDRLVASEGAATARLSALSFLARYFRDDGRPEDELSALEARLVAQTTELASLRDALALAQAAIERTERADAERLVCRLRREAALAHAPIPEADLSRVAALVQRGDLELARTLGELLLGRSQALDARPFRRPSTVRLEERGTSPEQASTTTQARILRSRGWDVEVTGDGAAISKATPAAAQDRTAAPDRAAPVRA